MKKLHIRLRLMKRKTAKLRNHAIVITFLMIAFMLTITNKGDELGSHQTVASIGCLAWAAIYAHKQKMRESGIVFEKSDFYKKIKNID